MHQFTEKPAIQIYKSGEWKDWTDEEIVKVQLFQKLLCVPFDVFHKSIEKVLGRLVWSHEFAFNDRLIDEYQKERPKPTFDEILKLLPDKKKHYFRDDKR